MPSTLQGLQPGLNLLALAFQERRQHQSLAEFVERLVNRETRTVGGDLEQNAVRLAKIQRVKPIAVYLAAVRDAHVFQARSPGVVIRIGRTECDMVHATGAGM